MRAGYSRKRGRLRASQRPAQSGDVLFRLAEALVGAAFVDQRDVAAAFRHGRRSRPESGNGECGGASEIEQHVDPSDHHQRESSSRGERNR